MRFRYYINDERVTLASVRDTFGIDKKELVRLKLIAYKNEPRHTCRTQLVEGYIFKVEMITN